MALHTIGRYKIQEELGCGMLLLSGSDDGTARLWGVSGG